MVGMRDIKNWPKFQQRWMKFSSSNKALCVFSAFVAAIVIGILLRFNYWQSNPELAFKNFTGRAIPMGIQVVAYSSQLNDNFLHFGHCFLLSGTPASLRQFTADTGLKESTEDARWMLPDVASLFHRTWTREQVVIGYEDNSPRNNWYLIFSGQSEALYIQN